MKKTVLFTSILACILLTSCSNEFSKEKADAIVDEYMQAQNETAEEIVYEEIDCKWDLYEELAYGNVMERMSALMSQSRSIISENKKPLGMLIVDASDAEEWYYNQNDYNTLKCIVSDSFTIEMYYCNPDNREISIDMLDYYAQNIFSAFPTVLECSVEDIDVQNIGNNGYLFLANNALASIYISDDNLMCVRFSRSF